VSPKPSTRPRSCSIWRVGRRILSDILKYKRTTYGDAIVATESRQLSWSHFVEIIPLKTNLHREFYAEMCRVERWCVRTLREKIGGMLFERTALSRKPEDLARPELAKLREKHEMEPGEETPIGLILCEEKGKSRSNCSSSTAVASGWPAT
jgi:uncharacterized protein DUF1016